jgi:transmembrane sensor
MKPPPSSRDTPAGAADPRELADDHHPLDVEAALWVARKQDGLRAQEETELRAWLAGDPARGARLHQLENLWRALDHLPADDVAALKTAAAPAPATPALARPGRPAKPERRSWLMGWSRLAPTLAMAGLATLLVGGGWLGWHHLQQQPIFSQSFATQRGQQLSTTLPDNSTLRLDTATQLDVALFRQRREVHLRQGQALFEVEADATRPFHVLAGSMRITVLGTRFSVRYAHDGSDAGRVRVVVEEGRVRVARSVGPQSDSHHLAATDAMDLVAGQGVVADPQGQMEPVAAATLASATAWRTGRVVLSDTPLGDAVAEFERYVDTGLIIRDPAVAELRLNGSFDLRQVESFKRALPQVLPVRLRTLADGTVEVVGAN